MASKTEKIAALEERLSELETLLSDPLALFARALKSASAEEAKEWVLAAHEKIMAHTELWSSPAEEAAEAAPAKKSKKAPKEKAATTNKEGPTAWNTLVQTTWRELAAEAGVDYDSFFEDVDMDDAAEVKKADAKFKDAAKKAGADYQTVLKEASARKDAAEGRDHAARVAEKTAKREKKAASAAASETSSVRSAPSVASAPAARAAPKAKKAAAAPKKPKADPAEAAAKKAGATAEYLAELATMSIFPRFAEDTLYYIDQDTNEAFVVEENGELGERVGLFDAENGTVE